MTPDHPTPMRPVPDEDRTRGLMAGLLLGDALGEADTDGSGLLHGTCLGQLACFTLEGMIRASVRQSHRGICSPAGVVWRAYQRWAAVQGIPARGLEAQGGGEVFRPDGWLWQIAPLSRRRGSAPATVAALQGGRMGTTAEPVHASAGHHALTRTLPVAIFATALGDPGGLARELAALTHGAQEAWEAAALGTELVARALREPTVEQTLAGFEAPGGGKAGTAGAALAAGCMAARAHPRPDQLLAALEAAREVEGAATFAGALLGAQHGRRALPQHILRRLEIGWVADQLARDALVEQATSPSGSEYRAATDPDWWDRYPGY